MVSLVFSMANRVSCVSRFEPVDVGALFPAMDCLYFSNAPQLLLSGNKAFLCLRTP